MKSWCVFLTRIRFRCAIGLCLGVLFSATSAFAFQLTSMDAERVDLDDYIGGGRWTLVMFWSTDCIPCEQQKPMIEAFHQDHHSSDAHVVGVALDGLEYHDSILALIDKHQPSYPNLVAYADVIHRQFNALTGKDLRATPTYLLFSPDGELAGTRSGAIERTMLENILEQ